MISSNKLLYSTVTSLQVGKDTTEERQRMKEELGRELRDQINKRGERDRTESSKRKAEGENARSEWTNFNNNRDMQEKQKKLDV